MKKMNETERELKLENCWSIWFHEGMKATKSENIYENAFKEVGKFDTVQVKNQK